MRIRPLLLPALLAAASLAGAQTPTHLALGDMVLDADITQVRVMPETGFASTPFTVSVAHNRLLWDPANPDSFYVAAGGLGSTGSVRRMEFVGGGQIEYTTIAGPGSFASPLELDFDQAGDLIMFGGSNLSHIDVDTGVVTPVTSGFQPWGNIGGGAVDPLSGDIYVSNGQGEIWRRASNGSVSLYTSGLSSGQTGSSTWISNLAIDSVSSPRHYLYYTMATSLRRIDLNDPAKTEEVFFDFDFPSGQLINPVAYDFDTHGDIMLRDNFHQIWRLDNLAVLPVDGSVGTFLGQADFPPAGAAGDIAVVGGTPSTPFRLDIQAIPGGGGFFDIQNVAGPVGFGWMLISASTFLPKGSGPMFGLMPDALTTTILSLPAQPGGVAFVAEPLSSFVMPAPFFAPFIGTSWDGVMVSFASDGTFLGQINVSRVTWE